MALESPPTVTLVLPLNWRLKLHRRAAVNNATKIPQ